MDEFKWLFAFLFALVLVVCVSALFAGERDAKTERIAIEQCLSNGGQWVTQSVRGNHTNHDCVLKGE